MKKTILIIGIIFLLVGINLAPITTGNNLSKSYKKINIIEDVKQSLNTPLDSSWSMYQHDAANTGYSSSIFPNSFNQVWFKSYQNDLNITMFNHFVSPVTNNGKLFIHGDKIEQNNYSEINYSAIICALNQNNGSLIWKKEISTPVTLSLQSYKSPAIYEGKIFVTLNSFFTLKIISKIVALDENTGNLIWEKTFLGTTGYSSVTVVDDKVFVGGHFTFCIPISWLYVFDVNSGELLWSKTLLGYLESTPVVSDNKVFAATSRISGMLIFKNSIPLFSGKSRIYAFDINNGQQLWMKQVKGHLIQCSPTVANDKLFIPSTIIFLRKWSCRICALDTETGVEIWDRDFSLKDYGISWPSSISTPSVAFGKVFLTDASGWLHVIDQETGVLIWEREMFPDDADAGSNVFASPVVIDGKVIVGANPDISLEDNELFMFNESSGELLWDIKIGGESSGPFIVSNEMLFVNDGEDGIYAFG